MNLVEVLDSYNANTIKKMFAFLGKTPKTYKQDNVKYLAAFLPQPDRVRKELQKLDKAELVALTRLAEKNGRMSAARLESLLKSEPDLLKEATLSNDVYYQDGQRHAYPNVNPNYKGKPSFPDLIGRLTCKGLLFSEQPLDSSKSVLELVYGRFIFLPDYTLEQLKHITLPKLSNPAEIAPAHIVNGSSTLFVRDLSRYGRFLQDKQTLNLTTQNHLYKDDLKTIAAQMSFPVSLKSGVKETDNGHIYFLRRLLPKVGLGQQRYPADSITAVPNAPLWQMDIPDRVQQAFLAWRDKGAWYELTQLHHYKRGSNIFNDAPKELVKARNTVLNQMKVLGGGWVTIHELIEDIKDNHYGFLFPNRHTNQRSSWYYTSYRETHPYVGGNNTYDITFDNIRSEKDGWDKVEVDFINHIIAGPLFWMGLVDLGYSKEPSAQDLKGNIHIDGYRLTEMGLWLLGMGQKPAVTSESGNLIIQPNFEILMMAPFADEALLTLDQFADVHKETKHVITYELTRLSVYRGQKQGWEVPRIAQWLDQNSSQPLPQNVQRTLDEWDALHNRIVIHTNTTLIETADSNTTAQIKEHVTNGRFPAPTITIAHATGKKIATQLRNAGWLPIITHAKQTTAPNSVQIDQNGRITFLHPTPSIYAKGIVYPLSSETGNGRILTETQIKATISEGTSYEKIERSLASIHLGPLPQPLINKLKAWSKYYGDARQESLILIEFENAKNYQELLNDPDLNSYLKPFPANGRFLATIHPLHIETVHALLAERGIDIHEGLGK